MTFIVSFIIQNMGIRMNTKTISASRLAFMAIAIVINIIGCNIALILKLPVYLDSIGTILAAVLIGPVGGMLVGSMTAIVNGLTTDPVSLYFMPVQICIGLMAGVLFKKGAFKGWYSIISIVLIGLVVSMVSAVIVANVFNGVTTSGSSLIVAFLHNSGMNLVTAVFSVQIITDLADKAICFAIVFSIIRIMPPNYKQKIVYQ